MKLSQRSRFLVLAALLVLVILAFIAVPLRQRFLTRGMPAELPGPNPHAAVSPYGINVDLLGWDAAGRDAALAQLAEAGFDWIRQPVTWGETEELTPLLQAAAAQNIEVLPVLDGDPSDSYAPPDDLAAFAAWVGNFAARYGRWIDYYQIWDEPNLGSHWGGQPVNPAGYAALLAAAQNAIVAADPSAVVVAAALAPTVESGGENLSDVAYLEDLYELGADAYFDVAAGKPYGFDTGPDDRRVDQQALNFSRLILLREVMERHGDSESALWAGNWGWNSLPAGWQGQPSIWGQTDLETQVQWIRQAYQRAQDEWPWSGVLFLENYAPDVPADDPRWGFALLAPDRTPRSPLLAEPLTAAPLSGFQFPDPGVQQYAGDWEFDAAYGADISQSGDRVRVAFDGTDFGLRVRRGNYRAYLYVTVDGLPANEMPTDERGAYLNLTSPDEQANDVATVAVASHLESGRHVAEIVAERGWDQWALVGFTAANLADERNFHALMGGLALAALLLVGLLVVTGRRVEWSQAGPLARTVNSLGRSGLLVLGAAVAGLFALSGWMAWLNPAGDPFRRLGDGPQTLVLAAVAALFYYSPWLLLNVASGLLLFFLILRRLDLGLALIALSAPFYVYPKPLLGYQFSMVEMVTLMTLAAWGVNQLGRWRAGERVKLRWRPLDVAVGLLALVALLSLFFTERLDVATNELRVVLLEPALFYLMVRTSRLGRQKTWRVVDAFVLGGFAVAVAGLVWYLMGSHVITAEGGLPRLRSMYGSPNNVGLYLGRVIPLLLAVLLAGKAQPRLRRRLYGLALLSVLAAVGLSFSKGALILGLPAGIGFVLAWLAVQRWGWRRALLLLGVLLIAGVLALLVASRVPALAGRLSLTSATTDFRVSLWRASAQMVRDHPLTGVGLDNFLYQYRGRYMRPEAWQEPDLSHPHNFVLDFWLRLGMAGLAIFVFLQIAFWREALRQVRRPGLDFSLLVGLMGGMAATLAHGLVDQSFFLIDLAFALMLACGVLAGASKSPAD